MNSYNESRLLHEFLSHVICTWPVMPSSTLRHQFSPEVVFPQCVPFILLFPISPKAHKKQDPVISNLFSMEHKGQRITSVPRLGLELPPVPCAPRALKETESNIFEPHRQLPCPRIRAYVVSFSLHFSPYVFPTPLGRDEKPGCQLHWRGIYITPRRASGREAG